MVRAYSLLGLLLEMHEYHRCDGEGGCAQEGQLGGSAHLEDFASSLVIRIPKLASQFRLYCRRGRVCRDGSEYHKADRTYEAHNCNPPSQPGGACRMAGV